jgi:RND superfamily putative drug exporter
MGRWSAAHWKTAVFGWLAFVVAAVFIGQFVVKQKNIDPKDTNVGEAGRGDHILQNAGFPQSSPVTEIVVVQSKTLTIADPEVRRAVKDVINAVSTPRSSSGT